MLERLFVYGTLAPGRPNAHVLSGVPGTWQPAATRGKLLPEGWGSAQGYPGIVLDGGSDTVEGLVFSSDELGHEWRRLDAFEGPGYQRSVADVLLADGQLVQAFIYELRR